MSPKIDSKDTQAETGKEKTGDKKPVVSPKRPSVRQMPPLVTKDTNDIGDMTDLKPSKGIAPKITIDRDVFASDEFIYESGGYSRSRTIDGSMLPQERLRRSKKQSKPSRSVTVNIESAERFEPDADTGLPGELVEKRTEEGLVNRTKQKTSKTFRSIFFGNIFTPINLIAIAVAVALIVAKSDVAQYMFIIIIGINMTIGIAQEIRAKITVEKLSILSAPSATVVRDGEKKVIRIDEVVLDDILFVEAGKQICADAIVVRGEAEVNESLLTGESVPVKKITGSELYSGSFVAAGNCYARVNKIGSANYVETLTSHAKKYKKPKSELFNSVNLIIKIIIPLSLVIAAATIAVYYWTNIHAKIGIEGYDSWPDWQDNIQRAAAVMIGMLPTGMFLLTSTALVFSVVRLGHRKTLVKDMNCIEMLARADVLCLDKTGTITDGTMVVRDVIEIKGSEGMPYSFKEIVGSILSATGDNNQTAMALADHFGYSKILNPSVILPFSSSRKLAAVSFGEAGTFLYGAPEFVLRDVGTRIDKMINEYASQGLRVLVVAHSPAQIIGDKLPAVRRPLCLITIEDHIRADAYETIRWFKENNVAVKVISGDNPVTVSEVARRVGVDNAELYISLEKLSNREVFEAAHKYTVFGRVTPEQKMLLVKAMKQKGKTVAMTGDGVNDILAMRESDCAVAIASGAEAARNVAHLVLQDSSFTSMPQVVKEGRKVINNIQQTSSLFLMKTFMTILLSVVSLLMRTDYPYKTSYLLMLEFFIIAGASGALAFQANTSLIKGKFISNVIGRSAPGGITLAVATLSVMLYQHYFPNAAAGPTMLVLCVTMTGYVILVKLCEPTNLYRTIMLLTVAAMLAVGVFALPGAFGIMKDVMSPTDVAVLAVIIMGSYFFVSILIKIMRSLKILN